MLNKNKHDLNKYVFCVFQSSQSEVWHCVNFLASSSCSSLGVAGFAVIVPYTYSTPLSTLGSLLVCIFKFDMQQL